MTHSLFGIIASSFRSAVSPFFNSLYESFAPLTDIINQHFVEWFSGDDIDATWTVTNITGTGSATTQDVIDGGCIISSGANVNDETEINFNNKRQYDPANSVIIFTYKKPATGGSDAIVYGGLTGGITSADTEKADVNESSFGGFVSLLTGDASSSSSTNSTIAESTSWKNIKIECGASNIKLYVNGVLEVTKTTNRPTVKLQPHFAVLNSSVTGADELYVRYCEAYNTTVSILSSLAERLYPLTSIMKQRVIEYFGGNALDERWTTTASSGSGAMNDEINGGYRLTSGAGAGNNFRIHFNNKRQYDPANFTEILVYKYNQIAGSQAFIGVSNTNVLTGANHYAQVYDLGSASFIELRTCDGTTASNSASDVAPSTNDVCAKIVGGASDIKLYLNGVLKVTKTTNRPTSAVQPIAHVENDGGNTLLDMKYLEIFNVLAGFVYESVYEMFQALTTVAKTKFVEWFSGNGLRVIWTQLNVSSTPTFGIVDDIDGGAFIKTNTTSGCQGKLTFNNKRQYDPANSIIIGVWKSLDTTSCDHAVGLMNDGSVGIQNALARAFTGTSANFILNTADATETATASDIAIDTSYHTHKVECGSANIKLYIDGVLKVTKTTNRPTVKLQPIVQARTLTTAEKEVRCRYLEAKNV